MTLDAIFHLIASFKTKKTQTTWLRTLSKQEVCGTDLALQG